MLSQLPSKFCLKSVKAKTEIQACKNKFAIENGSTIKAITTLGSSKENKKIPALSNKKIETEAKEWLKNLGKKSFSELSVEDIDHTQKF